MPPMIEKKYLSDDQDNDGMGPTNKSPVQQKQIKKRKKNIVKRLDQEEDIDSVSIPIKKAVTLPNVPPPPSPIVAEDEKKKKKKLKPKATLKRKAPLDLDRQCGVLISPNNNPCMRSLTCKIHAMGAKRAVEGRTHPFNELLAAYQKKGIGRPQVPPAASDNQQTPKKDSLTKTKSSHPLAESTLANQPKQENIDSDEETEHVRMAIEQSRPWPLGKKQVYYARRKREYHKLRDILLEAITPKDTTNGNSLSSSADFSQTSSSMDQIIY